ncbi:PucR family transcriptional regulator [Micrococcus flavus]|uniref:Uncharacterized protein n=1 Tax=Micrococcus flavus TaxID=384602 RepID=A0A4Y8WZ44_9MICC|nr:helix-turn-helix domain-containing protein [Micrococcus flavus]MBB4883894.1 hypothetical protein [Micrococcus flavus]TFI00745.1 PucR family transcriptional regulator [Micrococcus flavus]GGK51768.1 hypothetical protein GCM10007073_18690 [Micrococcus flavus]
MPRSGAPSPPWQALPADLADALAPVVPGVADRIIGTVPDQIPAYAAARDGGYGKKIAFGVRTALGQLLSLPGTSRRTLNPETRDLMASLGAGEFREGRTMDHLLGAYRLAARIAFRELSEECARQGMAMGVVVDLGESIWAYIDELSAVSAQAYAAEQSARAGVLERHRAELAAALLHGTAAPAEIDRLSVVADWPVPERLTVAVLPEEVDPAVRAVLVRRGLVLERGGETVLVAPSPRSPAVRRRMLDALAGTGAVVGPTVIPSRVPTSHRVARALAAQRPGLPGVAEGEAILAEEHLGAVVLGAAPEVLRQLSDRVLAPLDGLTDGKRRAMEDTLASWLRHWGQRAPMARELSVHPQTVGYRVGRLRELFGDVLEDPDARFDLELALRGRAVVTGGL